jgi:hypothetical protein
MKRTLAKRSSENVSRKTARWRSRFIRALSKLPDVKRAAKAAGVSRWKVYNSKKTDPAFAERLKEVLEYSLDEVEARLFLIGLGKEKCDATAASVMMWLLRCHRGNPYDPVNKSEVAVAGGIIFLPQKKEGKE